jgi:hypothetical protein
MSSAWQLVNELNAHLIIEIHLGVALLQRP